MHYRHPSQPTYRASHTLGWRLSLTSPTALSQRPDCGPAAACCQDGKVCLTCPPSNTLGELFPEPRTPTTLWNMGSFVSAQAEENEWKSDARHAMEAGVYCVVCGNPFDIEGDVYNIDAKDTRFQWLYQLRLLGNVEDVDNHMVASEGSTPENVSDVPGIFLSEPASYSVAGIGYIRVGGIWFDTLTHVPGHGTLFPLHEACIATSCRVVNHYQSKWTSNEQKPALAVLSQLLNTRFVDRNNQNHESSEMVNDLFDLSSSSNLYGPRSALAMTRIEWWGGMYDWYYANPVDDTETTSFVQKVLQNSPRSRDQHVIMPPTREPKGLERLPTELLDEICSYVPAQSVIALHQTSKALAIHIPLDTAFWRNSLRGGSLHPHIWDLDTRRIERRLSQSHGLPAEPTDSWDWRSAARLLATKRFHISGRDTRLDDVPNGFWNRCRVWATMEEALQELESDTPLKVRKDSCISPRTVVFPPG